MTHKPCNFLHYLEFLPISLSGHSPRNKGLSGGGGDKDKRISFSQQGREGREGREGGT